MTNDERPLKERISAEVRRTPIQAIAPLLGLIFSALSLLLPYLGVMTISVPSSPGAVSQTNQFNLFNLAATILFFLASTFSTASLVRLIARFHEFGALILSIPAAVLTAFLSLLLLHIAPPKAMNAISQATAVDIVFYGTTIIFVAINGLPVLQALGSTTPRKDPDDSATTKDSVGGALVVAGVLLMVWGALVSSGISKLVTTFL